MGKETLLALPTCPFYVDNIWGSKTEVLGKGNHFIFCHCIIRKDKCNNNAAGMRIFTVSSLCVTPLIIWHADGFYNIFSKYPAILK